jgi:hypothetical protein
MFVIGFLSHENDAAIGFLKKVQDRFEGNLRHVEGFENRKKIDKSNKTKYSL